MEPNKYTVELMSEGAFENYWPHIQEMMLKVPHTWRDLTLESVYERGLQQNLQVWGVVREEAIRMVLFTEIRCHASGRVLEIIWACGDRELRGAADALDGAFERFARFTDCGRIHIRGRLGWERFLAPRGFKKIAVLLERKVGTERMQ